MSDFKASKPILLLGYVPAASSGWILELLFRDLANSTSTSLVNYHLCKSFWGILRSIVSRRNWYILCMHPSFSRKLILLGIPPSRILAFYTHTRLGTRLRPKSLAKLKALLPMNNVEANILVNEGIPEGKVHVFSMGYSSKMFNHEPPSDTSCLEDRPYDVLLVGRYVPSPYYAERKNYRFIVDVLLRLLRKKHDIKVALLGPGWEQCADLAGLPIHFLNASYDSYPEVYRSSKIYINLSRQEGGPISWLEALACGCYALSTPSGFPLELRPGELYSWILPFACSSSEWADKIISILSSYVRIDDRIMDSRKMFLKRFEFSYLSKRLESLLLDD